MIQRHITEENSKNEHQEKINYKENDKGAILVWKWNVIKEQKSIGPSRKRKHSFL